MGRLPDQRRYKRVMLSLSVRFMLADGTETVMPLACPHLGLPLSAEPDAHGIVTCPWHGYRFDVRSGRCVSGQSCFWTV